MKLCIIPARGGSKRIPRKNIREFCGKPMIVWSIESALNCSYIDKVIVSTDDLDIVRVAADHGASVPFIRPPELCDDFTSTIKVIAHAIAWLQDHGQEVDCVCCIYATAPFVRSLDIEKAGLILSCSSSCKFVFSASAYPSPIQRAFRLDPSSGMARMYNPENFHKRTQDLLPTFYDAAQFYWGRPIAWLNSSNLFENSKPYILPKWCVQDIDDEDDWIMAEYLHRISMEIT